MRTVKKSLVKRISQKRLSELASYTTDKYRPLDPGQYLYKLVTDFDKGKKFSNKFIQLSYTTLMAWNMNQRGAKLSRYDVFKKSILAQSNTLRSLEKYRIESLKSPEDLKPKIRSLFKSLRLVARGKPKLVTYSKTLHYFLPNLLMPIDRRYTLNFFYNSENFKNDETIQFELYWQIFTEFRKMSESYNFKKHIDRKWNRNVPKIIDNIIIAYMKKRVKMHKSIGSSKLQND